MSFTSSDLIAVISSVATISLSIFVYRATKRAADATVQTTKLTEQSILLNEKIFEQQLNDTLDHRRALRLQYTDSLWKKARLMRSILGQTIGLGIHKSLGDNDLIRDISVENLALAFSADEVRIIHNAWFVFENYLGSYYRPSASYPGESIGLLVTHADKPIEAFTELEELLEKIKWNK